MKNIKLYLLIFPGLILLNISCTKFLDRQPISQATEPNFYRNTNEVETGVIGTYASMQDVYNRDYVLAGLRSDDSYISQADGDINQIDGFKEIPTNSYVEDYWVRSYFTIKQCNTVLKYLNNVTDTTKKKYFEGEVKFIRAHMYFNLVRLYGDVPLVTKSVEYNDTSSYRRINKDTVYSLIVSDFKTAVNNLPDIWGSYQVARVTNRAAKGMLAKVYLTLGNTKSIPAYYDSSKALLLDLLNNPGQYQLLSDYTKVFGLTNEMNNEIMYAVRYQSNANGNGNEFYWNMDNRPGSHGFKAAVDYRGTSTTLFPVADSIRKNMTFLYYLNTAGTSLSYYCGGKYVDKLSLKYDAGSDFTVLRYADIIMMYAEVENEINGNTPLTAADATNPLSRLYQLNRIRARAAGPVPAAVPVYAYNSSSVNTQVNFRTTIKQERRREFGEEDQRFYDLLRWGWTDFSTYLNNHLSKIGAIFQLNPDGHQMLYPIPQTEIDLASGYGVTMPQNPGY